MKYTLRSFVLASAVLATAALTVKAATTNTTLNVPFAFTVGNHTCPAGHYTVQRALNGDAVRLIGSNQSFTITTNSGYALANVVVDGVSQGAISSYTFNNVTTNHTIAATFNSSGGGGIISVNYAQGSDSLASTNVAGVVATNFWNNIIHSGSNYQTPTNGFYDCTGSGVSPFTVTLSQNNWNTWNTGGNANQKLYADWAVDGGGTVTFTNIPYANYSIYVYFTGFGSSNVVNYSLGTSTNKLVDTMGTPNNFTNFVSGYNYVVFTNLSGNSQVMTVAGVTGGSYGMAAFQIVQNASGQPHLIRSPFINPSMTLPVLSAANLTLSGGFPTFVIPGTQLGYQYTLIYKNNLTDPAWTPLTGSGTAAGTGGIIDLSDTNSINSQAQRFYRLQMQ